MKFAREIWLYAVPLVPVLWLLLRWGDRRSRSRLQRLLGTLGYAHIEEDHPRVRAWSRFLLLAGIFWLLLAAARPQWGASEVTVTQRGSDIAVALDISNSMLAQDVVPDRISRAKGELDSFLDRLTDSRIGLVFFAGSAFVQCPLTLDYATARIFLDMAGPDMLSEQGTAIAAALKTAHELLTRGRGDQPPGFQAILLVTDGEDLEGDWEAEAKRCLDDGIRIIPVGVGTAEGGLIPVTDDKGQPAGFMKGQDGSVVMSRLDMASLEKLAALSGGSAFRIGVDGLAGDKLFAELARLGKRDLQDRRISAYKERYLWPLLLALICFWARCLLEAGWSRQRGGALAQKGALLLLLPVFLTGGQASAGIVTPQAEAMARGRQDYLKQDYQGALSEFGAALVHDPDNPRISLALGEALSRLKKYDDAVREFGRTLELTDDPALKAEALYNAGTTLLAAGKAQDAVSRLKESLALDPDQPDALANLEQALELLRQQQQQQKDQQQKQQDQNQDQQKKDKQQDQSKDQQQKQQQEQGQQDRQQNDNRQDRQQQQQEQQQEQQDQQKQQEHQKQQEQKEQQKQQDQDKQQPQASEGKKNPQQGDEDLDREHALQVLKALDRDEQELKRSVQKRLKGGKPRSGKRW